MATPSETVLLHSSDELNAVLELRPDLRSASFYFLTPSVSEESVRAHGIAFSYFDECLSDDEFKVIYQTAIQLADSWYRDADGNDLSELEGCSFGVSMYYFINHVFCQTLKYQAFLRKIFPHSRTLVLTETEDPLLSVALKTASAEFSGGGPTLIRLTSRDTQNLIPSFTTINKSREAEQNFDPKWTFANLARWLTARVSQKAWRLSRKPRVVLVTAGKSSLMARYLAAHDLSAQFILQLNSDTLKRFYRNIYFYLFPLFGPTNRSIEKLKHQVLERLEKRGPIPVEGLEEILSRYITPHFSNIFAYYQSSLEQLRAIRPQLVVLSADRHETHILIALAAKRLGIKTATIPHGYPMSVLPTEYYSPGKRQVYNSAFVLSASYKKEHVSAGYQPEEIYVSSLHHFSQLRRESKPKHSLPLQSALILTPDFTDSTRLNYQKRALQDMMDCCLDLGINRLAIKARLEIELKNLNIRNGQISHRGMSVAAYSGYGNLRKYAEQFNVLVGSFSSATLEGLIQGFSYFAYLPADAGIGMWDTSALNDVLYVARTTEELKFNIENCRIFRPGKGIDDLVLVTPFKNEDDFFNHFTDTVLECAEGSS